MAGEVCISCKRNISNLNAAKFPCPDCGKVKIVRCSGCRSNAVVYECSECGFKGPN